MCKAIASLDAEIAKATRQAGVVRCPICGALDEDRGRMAWCCGGKVGHGPARMVRP